MLDAAMADIAIRRNNELVSAVQRDEELIQVLTGRRETSNRIRRDVPIMFNLGDEMLQPVSSYELASMMGATNSDQETNDIEETIASEETTVTGEILDAAIRNLAESRIYRVGQTLEREIIDDNPTERPNTPVMYVSNPSTHGYYTRHLWSNQGGDDVPTDEAGN